MSPSRFYFSLAARDGIEWLTSSFEPSTVRSRPFTSVSNPAFKYSFGIKSERHNFECFAMFCEYSGTAARLSFVHCHSWKFSQITGFSRSCIWLLVLFYLLFYLKSFKIHESRSLNFLGASFKKLRSRMRPTHVSGADVPSAHAFDAHTSRAHTSDATPLFSGYNEVSQVFVLLLLF